MEFLKNNWRDFVVIAGFAIIAFIAFQDRLKVFWAWLGNDNNLQVGHLIALLTAIILAITGWAIYSQFEVAKRSQFNDQLGRGAELLAHQELPARVSGVRILEDLGKSVAADSAENKLVSDILLDFVREKAAPPLKNDGTPYASFEEWPTPKPREKRRDIEMAIKALGEIVPDDADVRRKYLNFSRLDLRILGLSDTNLKSANLIGANLQRANLKDAQLQGANLSGANLHSARLRGANLEGASLLFTSLQGANLKDAQLQGADLNGANLLGTCLSGTDLKDVRNLMRFAIERIAYHKDEKPKNLPEGLSLPKDRAYGALDRSGGTNDPNEDLLAVYFVKSDQPWSEKNVDEWVAKELAEEKELEKPAEERGIKGRLLDVYLQNESGRDAIVLVIKTSDGTKKKPRNNWDGSRAGHDGGFQERWEKANRLIGKRVKTSVWGDYDENKWWRDLEEIAAEDAKADKPKK